ncbi:hypothetical protein ABZV80_06260 [Streptomyces sp. NPDC005132]
MPPPGIPHEAHTHHRHQARQQEPDTGTDAADATPEQGRTP